MSGPIASSAREQESWLGAVRTAVDQAHLRSDAVAGLNTLADSLASYADRHGPAVARPPWAVLMAGAGRSRSWVGRRLAWLRGPTSSSGCRYVTPRTFVDLGAADTRVPTGAGSR